MKIVFLSNFYNHHQAFLSKKLYELTEGDYRFIAEKKLTKGKKELGYPELYDNFVIIYDSDSKAAQEFIDKADAVIVGSAPEEWIENRKKQGKLIFRYSERPLKNGFELWKYPYRFLKWHKQNPRKAQIYMLCASAYTAFDFSKFGLFKNKCFKWGYFPECKRYDDIMGLMNGKIKNEILWCGRFLDWKHPDDVLDVACRLKSEGKSFHITMVGMGEMKEQLEQLRDAYKLSEYMTFTGSVSTEKVREYMEKASIYLFTSDRKEGWGAVLNEAMNSGCAVVASSAAGSTPYLIKDGENGLIYPYGNKDALYQSVKNLLDDPELTSNLGIHAYETIVGEWNAERAAERFVELVECVHAGKNFSHIFESCPCSRA